MTLASGQKLQFDVFVLEYSLALEYQGEQHYNDEFNIGPQWIYQERDIQKHLACTQKGITLIEIPYWWDNSKDSLAATINLHQPGLISPQMSGGLPIPSAPPQGFSKGTLNFISMTLQNHPQ